MKLLKHLVREEEIDQKSPPHTISSHLIASHLISSHLISSYLIASHLIPSHLVPFHNISSHTISSHLIQSHLIPSHLIVSLPSSHLPPFSSLLANLFLSAPINLHTSSPFEAQSQRHRTLNSTHSKRCGLIKYRIQYERKSIEYNMKDKRRLSDFISSQHCSSRFYGRCKVYYSLRHHL